MCLGIDASHGDAERVQALPGRDNVLRDGNVKVDISEISDIRIRLNIIWIYVSVFEFNVVAKLIHPNPLRDIQIHIRFHLKTI